MSIEDRNCMFRTTHITTTANQQHMNMSEKCWKLLNGKLDVVVVDSQKFDLILFEGKYLWKIAAAEQTHIER